MRCAINHRMCPVSCVLYPLLCWSVLLQFTQAGRRVASSWRPTRRDSLNVSGHKWYTYHIFCWALCFCIWFNSFASFGEHIHQAMHDWSAPQYTLLFTHCRLSMWAINEAHRILVCLQLAAPVLYVQLCKLPLGQSMRPKWAMNSMKTKVFVCDKRTNIPHC